jgi:O-succinylbenzoate synthase
MGSKEDVLEKAGRLRDEGYRAVKLKVGRQDVAQDIELVQELRGVLRGHASLRLDANRAWDLETALTFARGVANQGIEYIEEPITVPLDLPEFVQRSGLPVALDESLAQVPETRGCLKDKDWAKAVILKPTLLGGVARCEQLAYEALEFGIKPVVSSCFESGLGLCALAHLASAITAEDIPAGLDTYDWLAEDVLQTRFHVQDGALDIQDIDACAATLNVDTLERVYSG